VTSARARATRCAWPPESSPGSFAPSPRILLIAIAAAAAAMIGLSRLYLGVHWASDVVGGWLIGAMWLAVCLTAARVATTRRPAHEPGFDPRPADRDT
jgi:membrane-associated phospholipid phosphatase